MAEQASRASAAVQVGVVLIVLCVGLAVGSLLATRSVPSTPGHAAGAVEGTDQHVRASAATAPASPGVDASQEGWTLDSVPAGSAYAPVVGSIAFEDAAGEQRRAAAVAGAPATVIPEPPGSPASPADSSIGIDASAVPAPNPRLTDRDDVGALAPGRASEALLFGVSTGVEIVLFDVGIAGAAALPPSIRGQWAWVGTCSNLRIEISQLPGSPAGGVRGLGTGAAGDRFGWVVPRSGCRAASGRSGPTRHPPRPIDVDAPREVQELRSLGVLPCVTGALCAWFVGLDARGRPIALLASGGGNEWILLGPGSRRTPVAGQAPAEEIDDAR
jgi:hypothetical protein